MYIPIKRPKVGFIGLSSFKLATVPVSRGRRVGTRYALTYSPHKPLFPSSVKSVYVKEGYYKGVFVGLSLAEISSQVRSSQL